MHKAHQRSTMGKIFWEIYLGYDLTYVHPYRLLGWGGRQTSGDGSVLTIVLDGKLCGSAAFGNPCFSGGKSH